MEIARHGTVYTAVPSEKIHSLKPFTIYIDLITSSNGLSSFEKIFGYFINQREMNFIVGQWKDGMVLHLPDYNRQKEIHFGADDVLKRDERVKLLIRYDGMKLFLYQDGKAKKYRETGPLSFSSWSREYPLVVGTDAHGRSQWQGTIYEIAIYDRALSPEEVKSLSGLSRLSSLSGREGKEGTSNKQQAARKENPPQSPFTKGGGHEKSQDNRPLVHYIFRPENTYETELRGGKALGVRDLGKGEPADLVIPEQFTPYQRVYLGWDPYWMKNRSDWLDVAVNVMGFVPFGMLLIVQIGKWVLGIGRRGFGLPDSGFGIKKENPPQSPFTKGGGLGGDPSFNGVGIRIKRDAVLAVGLAIVVGLGVSLAIEWLQAYLPSRDSSLRDLITNALGTAIGAIAAAWMVRCRQAAAVDELIK